MNTAIVNLRATETAEIAYENAEREESERSFLTITVLQSLLLVT